MKLTLIVVGFLLGLALCGTAKAQALKGSELQEGCKKGLDGENTHPSFMYGTCLGFIRGVVDTQTLFEVYAQVEKSQPQFHYCMPEEVDMKQTVQVVLKVLNDHPERLHEPANVLVLEALHNAFRCTK